MVIQPKLTVVFRVIVNFEFVIFYQTYILTFFARQNLDRVLYNLLIDQNISISTCP